MRRGSQGSPQTRLPAGRNSDPLFLQNPRELPVSSLVPSPTQCDVPGSSPG